MMINLALVSGSWPPQACGVGDYTNRLANMLERDNINVERVSLTSLWSHSLSAIKMQASEIIHIQYPTMGYGRSIAPTLLPFLQRRKRVVVTIHEFSNFSPVRRPWFYSFAHKADARIFTNSQELNAFKSVMRPSTGLDFIVPIASNIDRGNAKKIPGTICSFGLLTPNKGIEDFLDLAHKMREDKDVIFSLVGAIADSYRSYADCVLKKCIELDIKTFIDLPETSAADIISTQEFAYLPYPDGATVKRGSLLAALANDLIVITAHSKSTSEDLTRSTIHVSSPDEARSKLSRLLARGAEYQNAREGTKYFTMPSWVDIARQHIAIYRDLLTQ